MNRFPYLYIVLLVVLLPVCTQTILAQSSQAKSYFDKGMKAYNNNYLVDASVLFTEAISKWPEYSNAYYYRAECFNRMNQLDHALTDYKNALLHDPSLLMPKIRLIHIYKTQQLNRQGVDMANQLLEYHPDNTVAGLMERGYFYAELGDHKMAIKDYQQFLELEDEGLDELKKEIRQRLAKL